MYNDETCDYKIVGDHIDGTVILEELGYNQNAKGLIHKFKLYDDDGILYFTGYSNNSSSFFPLDSLGAEYGCTEIRYLENGVYETL